MQIIDALGTVYNVNPRDIVADFGERLREWALRPLDESQPGDDVGKSVVFALIVGLADARHTRRDELVNDRIQAPQIQHVHQHFSTFFTTPNEANPNEQPNDVSRH